MDKDPSTITSGELAAVIVQASLIGLSSLVMVYVLVNRNYPPLKIKQIPLVLGSFVGGIIWWLGGLASLRVFPQVDNPVMLQCTLWGIWVQIVFGVALWYSLLILRFWRLYAIVRLKMAVAGRKNFYSFLVIWGIYPIFGIVTSVLKVNGPVVRDDGVEWCFLVSAVHYVINSFFGIHLLVLLFFAISLRGVKQEYLREYKEASVSLVIFVILFIAYSLVILFDQHFTEWGRIFDSSIIAFISLFSFYTIIGPPTYYCMFDREEHLKRFYEMTKKLSSFRKGDTKLDTNEHQLDG